MTQLWISTGRHCGRSLRRECSAHFRHRGASPRVGNPEWIAEAEGAGRKAGSCSPFQVTQMPPLRLAAKTFAAKKHAVYARRGIFHPRGSVQALLPLAD